MSISIVLLIAVIIVAVVSVGYWLLNVINEKIVIPLTLRVDAMLYPKAQVSKEAQTLHQL